jgi:glycyl-tRNA synthetase beta chain
MELVFEIFSEEIPARMQAGARRTMIALATKEFASADISFKSLNAFVSPRRLALIVQGLDFSKALTEKFIYKKGPSDTASAEELSKFKFLFKSQKFELTTKEIQGQKYFFAKLSKPKENPQALIAHALERILQEFPWPKSMRWDISNVKWVRPIRNLLCVLDGKTLPIKYGDLTSNNISFGHRFLSPKSFSVHSAKNYFDGLKKGKVLLDLDERKRVIKKQIEDKLTSLRIVEDEGLLEEVAGLVEYPFTLLGDIDKKFLELPKEIIVSSLKTHQKYFTVEDKNGKLAPHFIVVSNMNTRGNDKEILDGNQKVLRARLADAQFFFKEDRATSLASKVDALKKIIFHEKLGTVFGKVSTMEALVEKISTLAQIKFDLANAKRAAYLSKADLTTNLVKEFPELQGVIGKYYAKLDGENKIVAEAIANHYLPKGKGENFPASIEGAVVAIADKVSTLVGLFAAKEIPTSSKDPYALRRQALGIIKLLCHFKISLNTHELVDYALALFKHTDIKTSKAVTEFLFNRFKFFLKDQFKPNLIEAVLATSSGNFYSDFNKLICLTNFINSKEGNETFLSIKRILSLLEPVKKFSTLDKKLFNTHEKNLYAALTQAKTEVQQSITKENFEATLKIFNQLAKKIDVFFDKVLIMDDDHTIRANRISLLQEVGKPFLRFADFSHIDL